VIAHRRLPRRFEAAEQSGRGLELVRLAVVGDVPQLDDEVGAGRVDVGDGGARKRLCPGRPHVEVAEHCDAGDDAGPACGRGIEGLEGRRGGHRLGPREGRGFLLAEGDEAVGTVSHEGADVGVDPTSEAGEEEVREDLGGPPDAVDDPDRVVVCEVVLRAPPEGGENPHDELGALLGAGPRRVEAVVGLRPRGEDARPGGLDDPARAQQVDEDVRVDVRAHAGEDKGAPGRLRGAPLSGS
jgi:hypothetical protein